jgi:hypothetical protein
MTEQEKKNLEAAGWKVGDVDEFLELTPEETAIVEMRVALAKALQQRQLKFRAAKPVPTRRKSTNKGESSESIDSMIRSLLVLGASRREIAAAIA